MKTGWLLLIFVFVSVGTIAADDQAARYLDFILKAYAGLKDFTATINIHYDIEAMKVPDMKAAFYYKAPDKTKVDTKGIFFLPREGAFFNPFLFKPEDFEIIPLERLPVDSKNVVRLRLIPKKTKRGNQEYLLTVDVERHLIREITVTQFEGRIVKAAIDYGRFEGFQLPTRILIQFDMPSAESDQMREFDQFSQRGRRITGKVEITYSNYRVNAGLSDDLFKEKSP